MKVNEFILNFSKLQYLLRRYELLKNSPTVEELLEFFIKYTDRTELIKLNEKAGLIQKKTITAGISWINYYHHSYPAILKEIFDPPAMLFYKGNISILSESNAAVVGTRSPSPISEIASEAIPHYLKQRGFTGLISGMAKGIDRLVMLAANEAGMKLIGVMGTPINNEYPIINADLYKKMKQSNNTILISEYHIEEKTHRFSFPKRNRIISGLAEEVYIIESPLKSGAMSTANNAIQQNRELFIFNHPDQKMNQGGRDLIFQGANEITNQKIGINISHLNDSLPDFNSLPDYLAKRQKKRSAKSITELKHGYFKF